MPKAAEPAPDYVPAEFRKQWEAIYKDVYAREMKGKNADDEEAQKRAASKGFAAANGVIKGRKEKASEGEMDREDFGIDWSDGIGLSDDGYGGFLVTEENGKTHLPTRKNGKLDHGLMGAAKAALTSPGGHRGKKYAGPDKEEAIRKLKALYKSEKMDWSEASSEEPQLVWPLLSDYVERKRIPIAITGKWRRGPEKFSITLDHLKQMRANFLKRKNGEINLDYDHASELPEVAAGGPIPSAGSVTALEEPQELPNGRYILWGLCEPTERAKELVRNREYRFISPAINFKGQDKETGEDQGATLTSVAFTNRPFLEEMPRVQLSEEGFELVDTGSVHVDGSDPNLSIDHKQPVSAGNTGGMKMFQVRKLADGEHKGKHAVFDGDNMMGLAQVEPDADDQRRMMAAEEQFAQLLTDEGFKGQSREEVRAVVAAGVRAQAKAAEEKSHELLLSECIGPNGLDEGKASDLRADGKLTKEDYNAAREGQRRIANLIGQGKLLPRKAAGALRIFLYDRDLFKDQVEERIPHLPLRPIGAQLAADASGDFLQMVRDRQKEKNIEYHIALSEISRENPELAKAYREGVNSQQG